MFKKTACAVTAIILCISVISYASQDYAAELKQEQKKLEELAKQLSVQKQKLRDLADEYEKADMAMRRQLIEDKQSMDKKEFIRESKQRQKHLRVNYYKNKKPLKAEYNRLKVNYHKCKKSIKLLTKKIDRLADDPESEEYRQQIEVLKEELTKRKQILDNAIQEVRENADMQIAAISNTENRSAIRKQVLTEARDKELSLRKEYAADKAQIVAKMDKARADYKQNLKAWRMRRATERKARQLKKITEEKKNLDSQDLSSSETMEKNANTNFSPANS